MEIKNLIMPMLMLIIAFLLKELTKNKNTKFKKSNINKFQNNYKGNNMKSIKPTEVGEVFNKKAKEINKILSDIGFIENSENGWKLTKKGKENGGIQNNYKGNLSVYWDEKIKDNEILKEAINPTDVKDKIENDFRNKFKADYRTKSGHFVRSRAEVIIADWLYGEFICFAYEKRVPIIEDMYCDFYLPKYKIFIEFWGYEEENEKYIQRKNKKLEIYKKYDLNLIEIDNKTINNIDDFLPKEILKFKK